MSTRIITAAPRIHERGGALRVGDTSVTLDTVLWAYQQGSTPEDIVDQFPSLTLADVYEAIAYYLRHREDIDRYLTSREQHSQRVIEGLMRQTPTAPIQGSRRARRR